MSPDVWAFVKDFAKGAGRLATAWRRWRQEDRAEIEQTYSNELACLQEQLSEADTEDEKARIKLEIKSVREEQRSFHRARRELLLSKALVQRMTPKGTIIAGGPELPAPERQALRIAITLLQQLEPGISFADHFLRGNAFYAAQDFEKALNEYSAALALRPDDPDTLNNRAAALVGLKRYEEALANLNRSLQLRPDHPAVLNNRGVALHHLKRYEEALTHCDRSLQLRPDDPDTLNNRAGALIGLKRYREALADCDRSLELRPDHPSTLNNRGLALLYLQRYAEALADFNRALELRPDHANTIYNTACLYSIWERYDEAVQWLEKAIARDASCRPDAAEDADFAGLRAHPEFGPRFQKLTEEKDS